MSKETKQYYKFLNLRDGKMVSAHGSQVWEVGKEYSVKGKVRKCSNGFHASEEPLQALRYINGEVLALVEASGDSDNDTDKVCYRSMKITKAYSWDKTTSVTMAIYAAEQVLKIYEDKYPNDNRPHDAIKAAKAYLKDSNKKNQDAAAYAANAAANAAAYAAANAAANAAYAAANAAAYAAANAEMTAKINRFIKNRLKKLPEIR